jgi:hypothetical protein
MQTADSTWIQPLPDAEPVPVNPPKGLSYDEQTAERIAKLEAEIASLRGNIGAMMPAITKMSPPATSSTPETGANVPVPASKPVPPWQIQPKQPVQTPNQAQNIAPQAGFGGPIPLPPQNQAQLYPLQPPYQQQVQPAQMQSAPGTIPLLPMQAAQPGLPPAAYAPPQQMMQQQYQPPVPYQQPPMQMGQPPLVPQQQPVAYTPPPPAPPPQPALPPVTVSQLRFGEHPDKTRLVFDVSDNVAFSYKVDAATRTLLLDMPGTTWTGVPKMDVEDSPVVAAYNAAPDGQGGTRVTVQLKQSAQATWAQFLPPTAASGPRIIVDLTPM